MRYAVPPKPSARRPGFTLIEVLIASLLTATVLAMAMQGFTSAKRAADTTRSKATAASEATEGLKEITSILRHASIVYYSGVPILTAPNAAPISNYALSAVNGLPVITGSTIPAIFSTAPTGVAGPPVKYNITNPTMPYNLIPGAMTLARSSFRFQVTGGQGGMFRDSNTALGRLHSSDPAYVGSDANFSAPLTYCAEAILNPALAGGNQDAVGSMPIGWNFYVIYLAPMDITSFGDPLLPNPGMPRDMGGDAPKWPRSTIPFELRLLSIRNISAAVGAPTAPLWGRQVYGEPGPAPANQIVPPVPWDFALGTCNYDPIQLADDPTAQALITAPGFLPFSGPMYVPSIGGHDSQRINGGGPHTNFGALGNDPPTAAVFTTFLPGFNAGNSISDRVLCRYIDPDNVNGTCIRFENPYVAQAGFPHPVAAGGSPSLAGDRRYVDTIEGGFQYNANINLLPRRALVSVTTRYRTGKDLPFIFSTKSEEVSLEAAANYQNGTVLRRRRN